MSDRALELLESISARLDRMETAPATGKPVMSTPEAIEYIGLSRAQFFKWAARWRVLPCGHGRWPLHRINAGLER